MLDAMVMTLLTTVVKYCVMISLYCVCFSAIGANQTQLHSIDLTQDNGKTSLLFKLNQPTMHKIFTLTNPDRVVVDFEKTDLARDFSKAALNNQLIRVMRTGHPNPHTLRLVFEVTDKVMLNTTNWGKTGAIKNAFLLNISPSTKQILKAASATASVSPPTALLLKKSNPVPISKPTSKRLKDVIVVLDPGHGGKDPGASGPRHTIEKNVTLAIAYKLKQIIDKQPGMRAILTRNGDYYVGLRERLSIARKYNADVFVSIHADAFINRESNGASVFALSQRGATSEAARWLAEKENYSELGGVNLKNLDDQTGLVRTVLIDLSQTATIGASMHMGENVLQQLNRMTKLHNTNVEQARFMVLKSPDIPSILIETGFISNPREEYNLNNSRYQSRLTLSIFEGLKRYFWQFPPHGTQIEALVNKRLHIVQKGESLETIAEAYKLPIARLKSINNLNSSKVLPGQPLDLLIG